MPPKAKKAVAAKAPPSSLKDCKVAFSAARLPAGVLGGRTLADVKSEVANRIGYVVAGVDAATGCTHLVVTPEQYSKGSGRVPKAIDNEDVKIVSFDWLDAAFNSNDPVDEAPYLLHKRVAKKSTSKATTGKADQKKVVASRKRTRKADPADDDEVDDEDDKKKLTNKKVKPDPEAEEEKQPIVDGQTAKSSTLVIPLDDGVPSHLKVYIDDDGMIYDAALNQTNSGFNNNKFYRLQVLHDSKGTYQCWTRWGRVGERGQSKMMVGPELDKALKDFNKKFKDKSGHTWEDRHGDLISGKYTFIEKNYEDSDNEDEEADTKDDDVVKKEEPTVESKLPEPVQRLMKLIFNLDYFNQTFQQLNYDARKMPLGKLSKRTLLRGYDVLKDLSNLVGLNTIGNSGSIAEKSDQYFSLIPHAFGRNKPPILHDMASIKREIDLLETLTDMALANDIMKDAKTQPTDPVNLLDRQFEGLGMQEMTPLESSSKEYKELSDYLVRSAGQTHHISYKVEDIFRIERNGETDRFDQSQFGQYAQSDRRLLWHGSRCTNFGGILSQGLRIAPPEAPVSGYMFGKGIYLADISTKSANYCNAYSSGGTGLLLLCEAELGKPPLKLTNADYNAGENATKQGSISTWGVGQTAPKGWKDAGVVHKSLKGIMMPDVKNAPGPSGESAYLAYNEYIAYDVAQVKLRYLLRVKLH